MKHANDNIEYKLAPVMKSRTHQIVPAIEFDDVKEISHKLRGYDVHTLEPIVRWFDSYQTEGRTKFLTGGVAISNEKEYTDIDVLVVSPDNQDALKLLQALTPADGKISTFLDGRPYKYHIAKTKDDQLERMYVCGEIEAVFRFDAMPAKGLALIPKMYESIVQTFFKPSPIEVSIMTAEKYNVALNDNRL